jgi:hypothetical protein
MITNKRMSLVNHNKKMMAFIKGDNLCKFITYVEYITKISHTLTLSFNHNFIFTEGYCNANVCFYELNIPSDIFDYYYIDLPQNDRNINLTIKYIDIFLMHLKNTNTVHLHYDGDKFMVNGNYINFDLVKFNKTYTDVFNFQYKIHCGKLLTNLIMNSTNINTNFTYIMGKLMLSTENYELEYERLTGGYCDVWIQTKLIKRYLLINTEKTNTSIFIQHEKPIVIRHTCREYSNLQLKMFIAPCDDDEEDITEFGNIKL